MEENTAFKVEEEVVASGCAESLLPLVEEIRTPKTKRVKPKVSTSSATPLSFHEDGISCSPIESMNSFLLTAKEESEFNETHEGPVWIRMAEIRVTEPQAHTASTESHEKPERSVKPIHIIASLDDVRSAMFWKAVIAEFLGTFILVLTSVGSTVQNWNPDHLDVVQISLCFGLCVATSIWIIGHISGGHINPAVTMAMLCTRKISMLRALLFITSQCFGAIVGAGIAKLLTPASVIGGLGATTLSAGMSPMQGLMIECLLTMFLVLTVFASCDNKRTDLGGSFPLAIGLFVTMGHLWAVEYCGSSMNPARSLGPAMVMNIWKDHWIYWIGPILGGILGGLFYDNVIGSSATLRKARDFLMTSQFDDSHEGHCIRKIEL